MKKNISSYRRYTDCLSKYCCKRPVIEVGDYTIHNDFASNPLLFEQNNVLYHSLINHERLIISRYSGYPYSHVNIGMRISQYTGINPTNGTQLTSCR